jgi:hypothetical protein
MREDIESLSQRVTSAHREYRADGEAVIRDISVKVDSLLAKAWEITQGKWARQSVWGPHTPSRGEVTNQDTSRTPVKGNICIS